MNPRSFLVSISSAVLILVMLVMGHVGVSFAAGKPVKHTIVIENMKFNPNSLEVKRGEVVEWVNKDIVPHTATSVDHRFDSGPIEANKTWSFTAVKAGSFSYVCTFHPAMKGSIKVTPTP